MSELRRGIPADWGLPTNFSDWRVGQFESVIYCLEGTNSIKVLQAPVGSGKSGIAKAVAHEYSTMSLVRSKVLQETVYKEHGFSILFGRANYSCCHPYSEEGDTAQECMYLLEGSDRCPESRRCAYVIAKEKARRSGCASLNYALYLTVRFPKDDPPIYLFLDEAHLLSDIVLNWTGCTINKREIGDWYLSTPPEISYTEGMSLFGGPDPCQLAVIWLRECQRGVTKQMASLRKHLDSKKNGSIVKKRLAQGQNLSRKIQSTIDAIQCNPNAWFIVSGREALIGRGGVKEKGFNARPLTARYHFPSLFLHSPYTVLMSGTIGDPRTFAAELGIKDYEFRSVPSNFAPEVRPIQVLDVPHLNYKSGPKEYDQQADAIAKAVLGCDSAWSGIIHVTRKKEAPLLAERLAHRGLQDRVWVTPDEPTDAQMAHWDEHKRKSNGYGGQLAITWAWTEGVDLVDERICLTAKIPFPDVSDPYEKARLDYSHSFYAQRTAWALQQELARTRRGFDDDYDLNGQREQLVGIADGSWVRLKKYMDADFLESIVERK